MLVTVADSNTVNGTIVRSAAIRTAGRMRHTAASALHELTGLLLCGGRWAPRVISVAPIGAKRQPFLPSYRTLGRMNGQDDYAPSAGAGYLFGSVPLFVLGGVLLANTNEDSTMFGTGALLCFAFAVYLLLVGAVARGTRSRRG